MDKKYIPAPSWGDFALLMLVTILIFSSIYGICYGIGILMGLNC